MKSLTGVYRIGRGPSSSHSIGPERASADFLKRFPDADNFRVTLYGSLALTGKGHLTDEAIYSVLGRERTQVTFDKVTRREHPNTMDFSAYRGEQPLGQVRYLSVGGGNISIPGEKENEAEVYPFANFSEYRAYCEERGMPLSAAVFAFEGETMRETLRTVWHTMKRAVARGLAADGLLPGDLKVMRKAQKLYSPVAHEGPEEREKRLIAAYAFASAEENASGGTVVTAPTCGACGVLPAVLCYLEEREGFDEEAIINALAVAGMVGNVIKTNASVSGAEAGCQAEIGSATAMAAAAACTLFRASSEETEYAAEIALEHQLGLTCDPVHGYVQIPCIERNAVAALRALDSAAIAKILCGTRKISFDLIVETMYKTGKDINERYRETSEGGLAESFKGC